MAKMFYTLEETAETLGVSEDDVKQMVEDGKLQQFRDRDKVMFKRDQVDQLAPGSAQPAGQSGGDEDDDNDITLMPDDEDTQASKTDSIDLSDDTGQHEAQGAQASAGGSGGGGGTSDDEPDFDLDDDTSGSGSGSGQAAQSDEGEKKKSATGISVFGADEVEAADAMEETQVGGETLGDEEFNLDSGGGSGSGLLDLTRESDDTGLGAVELLEDVDTEGGQEDDQDDNESTLPTSSGVFEGALGATEEAETPAAPAMAAAGAAYAIEESDPPGDGFGGGMLLGVFVTLIAALLVILTGMQGMIIELTAFLSKNANAPLMYGMGGFAGLCIVLSFVGWMIGRSRG